MPSTKITKRLVDGLCPGDLVFDTDVKGFGVRCQGRRKVYLLKANLSGRSRWFVIGDHGAPWTPDTARDEAQRLWGEIKSGVNLISIREARRQRPTVAELCARYIDEHATQHKKASSLRMDRLNIKNHILPTLGTMPVADLDRSDLDRFKRNVRDGKTVPAKVRDGTARRAQGSVVAGGPGVANRCIALLSKMLNLAEHWGWRPEHSNPCRTVARYSENRRQTFLSTEEIKKLATTLDEVEASGSENPYVVAAIRLLLLTGARAGEILTLKWSYVDLQRSLLLLPDSKTGQKVIYLNDQAALVLRDLPRHPLSQYVVVGKNPDIPFTNIHKPWKRIKLHAGLGNVRIHDLRHSFASAAAASGASLLMIGKLLGHTMPQTTQRYAHLVHDPIKEMNSKVGASLGVLVRSSVGGAK